MADAQLKRDPDGRFICPYNSECRCTSTRCTSCGWNTIVGNTRLVAIATQLKVPAEVLAKLLKPVKPEEAKELPQQLCEFLMGGK